MSGNNFRRIGALDFCTSVDLVRVFRKSRGAKVTISYCVRSPLAGISRFDITDCQQNVKLCEWIDVGSHGSGRVPCATRRSAHG